MRFHDAHNHLHDERFAGAQGALIESCREVGIERMVVNGSCESDWSAVADLAHRFPDMVIPAFGLHPWYVRERSSSWKDRLNQVLDEVPGAVVGEIGVDRWILECPPAARAAVAPDLGELRAAPLGEQVDVFAAQWAIAAERNLPASVHCLQAWGALTEVLRSARGPERGFLLHSYGGPSELVTSLARLGGYFGFPGYFLHERKARHRDTFRAVPDERLLVETDAPDQPLPTPEECARALGHWTSPPEPRQFAGADGRPLNHPANLPTVYAGLATIRQTPLVRLANAVAGNFRRLFESPRAD